MDEVDDFSGIKLIEIMASTRYPVISAYEYEFLKGEDAVRQRMGDCTLYMIVQRPMTYFSNFRQEPGGVRFEIVDDRLDPLPCYLPLAPNGLCAPGETIDIELLFLKREPDRLEPFNDLGGFRLYRSDGEFIVWYSPQKFIYEVLAGSLQAEIEGDPLRFSNYRVHYIGKAFSQKVWKRLTGHHALQKILTLEAQMSNKPEIRAPWEISLVLLSIDGYDEVNVGFTWEFAVPPGVKPIMYPMNTASEVEEFYTRPPLQAKAEQLTSEMEAGLIAAFRPQYNDILYENYPEIANGTRSAGFTASKFTIQKMPMVLFTDHHRIEPVC